MLKLLSRGTDYRTVNKRFSEIIFSFHEFHEFHFNIDFLFPCFPSVSWGGSKHHLYARCLLEKSVHTHIATTFHSFNDKVSNYCHEWMNETKRTKRSERNALMKCQLYKSLSLLVVSSLSKHLWQSCWRSARKKREKSWALKIHWPDGYHCLPSLLYRRLYRRIIIIS